jgi:ferritin-like metal-binding protein YciE
MRVAEQAGEERVVEAANRIREDERRMEERIAGNFDRSVEESLRDVPRDDLDEQLNKYLADAHAVEGQAIELLERAPTIPSSGGSSRSTLRRRASTRSS